jgi:hypothetical protein
MRLIAHPVRTVAIVFAALHVLLVAAPLIISGGHGESQAFAVGIFDFPLAWLLGQSELGRDVLYGNLGASGHSIYMLIFTLGGTIFWAGVGALLAFIVRRAVHGRAR